MPFSASVVATRGPMPFTNWTGVERSSIAEKKGVSSFWFQVSAKPAAHGICGTTRMLRSGSRRNLNLETRNAFLFYVWTLWSGGVPARLACDVHVELNRGVAGRIASVVAAGLVAERAMHGEITGAGAVS